MKVLLISANTEQINMPVMPFGLACVKKAAQDAGHAVHAVNLMTREDIDRILNQKIADYHPQVIGISVRNIDDQSRSNTRFLLEAVKPVVDICKKLSKAPIVLGGAGYSIFPQKVLCYLGADMGIQGEGEVSFTKLLGCLETNTDPGLIPGLYMANASGIKVNRAFVDIDDMPLPEPDPEFISHPDFEPKDIWLPFQTRRGCPMNCSYCSTVAIEGKKLRKRSLENVVKAIRRYVDAGFHQFFMADNTFNLPASYAKAFCDIIIAKGIPIRWQAIIYPYGIDKELVIKMAKAGCVQVSLGFESGAPDVLKYLNKRFTPQMVEQISALFKSAGIRQMGFLLLGGPGETRQTVNQSLEFAEKLDLNGMRVTCGIRIYPHTHLARIAREKQIIGRDDDLLLPRFYLEKELGDWLPRIVSDIRHKHPSWIVS